MSSPLSSLQIGHGKSNLLLAARSIPSAAPRIVWATPALWSRRVYCAHVVATVAAVISGLRDLDRTRQLLQRCCLAGVWTAREPDWIVARMRGANTKNEKCGKQELGVIIHRRLRFVVRLPRVVRSNSSRCRAVRGLVQVVMTKFNHVDPTFITRLGDDKPAFPKWRGV